MANLSKTKALFGFTSPRTIEKIIPEIRILCENFEGQKWSGNSNLQISFFQKLYDSEFYEGEKFPSDPALAARDRITRAPKAFGFVDLQPNVKLTQAGKLLLSENRIDETFTRQLLKFQLPSPYHVQSKTVDFAVRPYLELIRLIYDLGSLSKTEIALFFSQLTNIDKYSAIVNKILDFRSKSKEYIGSRKMYVNKCFEDEILLIFEDELTTEKLKTRESSDISLKKFLKTKRANMKDYADAFVRYIRATELITLQKKTFRLVISKQKIEEVEFILKNIERKPHFFNSLNEFKDYLFNPFSLQLLSDDKELLIRKLESLGLKSINKSSTIEDLKNLYDKLKIAVKNKNIEEKKKELKNYKELPDILEVFDQIIKKDIPDPPLFLEWNVWRSFVMLNHAIRVDGNFIMDIDGMPLNTAPGNKPDLEIEFDDFAIIGEVTLSSGATQFKMEGDSVPRHFGNALKQFNKNTYCIFIAPNIHDGCLAHFFNLNRLYTRHYGGKTKIIPLSLKEFIEFTKIGVNSKFSNPSKLEHWLENHCITNQTIEDEIIWKDQIANSIKIWAA